MKTFIFGPSCVGKTSISKEVARILCQPIRACGDIVRNRAAELKIDIAALPQSEHRLIDRATLTWATEHGDCIVEGRFLDAFARDINQPLLLVELVATKETRIQRWRSRIGSSFSADDLTHIDEEDFALRSQLFSDRTTGNADIRFDTTDRSIEECVSWLVNAIREEAARPS